MNGGIRFQWSYLRWKMRYSFFNLKKEKGKKERENWILIRLETWVAMCVQLTFRYFHDDVRVNKFIVLNLLLSSFHQKYYILITLICISSISPTNFDPLRLCISNVFLPFFLRFQKSINTKWNNVSWRTLRTRLWPKCIVWRSFSTFVRINYRDTRMEITYMWKRRKKKKKEEFSRHDILV